MQRLPGGLSRALSSGVGLSQAAAPPSSGSRLSGLQLDVLKLYRALLRVARAKDKKTLAVESADDLINSSRADVKNRFSRLSNSAGHSIYSKVKSEFRERSKVVSRSDFETIEHMVRQGYKQKKLLEMPGFSGFQVVRKIDEASK